MVLKTDFFSGITVEYIWLCILAFLLLTLITALAILITLNRKRRNFHINQRIQSILDPWISRALLEEGDDDYAMHITPGFLRYLKRPGNRQFTIDQLINSKKNLIGNAAANIIKLYEALNLQDDSIRKIHHKAWHRQAKGIFELYMMHQAHMQPEILKYTNSRNEYVRMEAQTATIGFLGFEGLIFLDSLTQPLTDWQQLKLLEQLRAIDLLEDIAGLPGWLRSGNDYVLLFALKLADIYQQLHVHNDVVVCLDSENEKVRRQAIKTLARIPNDQTAALLIRYYEIETAINKRTILRALAVIAQESELPFLEEHLDDPDDSLKLEAAIAMVKAAAKGITILEARASQQPDPYLQIYLHAKTRLLV